MTDQDDEDLHDVFHNLLVDATAMVLKTGCQEVGRHLADINEHGTIVGCGDKHPDTGNRWVVMLATNDAARHLEDWAAEQVKMRTEALTGKGYKIIGRATPLDDGDATPPPPRNPAEDRK